MEFDANQPTLELVVEARDRGSPSLSSWATVQLQVLDVNDHSPIFQVPHYNASVPEDLRPGTTVLTPVMPTSPERTPASTTPVSAATVAMPSRWRAGWPGQVGSSARRARWCLWSP